MVTKKKAQNINLNESESNEANEALRKSLATGGMGNVPQSSVLLAPKPSAPPAAVQPPKDDLSTKTTDNKAEEKKDVSETGNISDTSAEPSTKKSKPQTKTVKAEKTGSDPDIEYLYLSQLIDAPKELNEWSIRPEGVLIDYALSIADTGLIHPLTVWEQPDGKYMILSGHNRKRAYQLLTTRFADFKDSEGVYFADKFQTVRCSVYPYKSLDINKAKRIINDANSNQRSSMSAEEKIKIAEQKLEIIRQLPKDSALERITSTFSLKKSLSYDLIRIAQMPKPLGSLYASGRISHRGAVKLASLPKSQWELLAKSPEKIVPAQLKHLNIKQKYTDGELTSLLYSAQDEPSTRVTFTVPIKYQDEFRQKAEEILAELAKKKK